MKRISFILFLISSVFPSLILSQDWTGYYGGITLSNHEGKTTYYQDGKLAALTSNPDDRDGTHSGLFGGYRHQNDKLVYALDIERTNGKLGMSAVPENHLATFSTVQLKIGYVVDNLLFTAGLGRFEAKIVPKCVSGCGATFVRGDSISIGAEMMLEASFTAGVYVTKRRANKNTVSGPSPWSWMNTTDDTAISLRLGYSF